MPRCRLTDAARVCLLVWSRLFNWREALVIVKPETLIGWHRKGFQLFWRWKSKGGRPRLPRNIRCLIAEMVALRSGRDGDWLTKDRALQYHRSSERRLDDAAAARSYSQRSHLSLPDSRPRQHLLGNPGPAGRSNGLEGVANAGTPPEGQR
jgi:hypothetical protein